ncbi:hypothetical protein RA27_02110 [Ruegeria sp. ANG-R]|uniref:hypothetical protein n=1 Tax=Ruegeria sp. ANG-R TaxID=1577903 RepID=UPI0005804B73|nr:hypothetical protein [Ruegeria sp. ANG-R]KIC42212.1 hypothetical protein RA27_02110 [Ruegeria sp. ANG-R]
MPDTIRPEVLTAQLRRVRFPVSTEQKLQDALEQYLQDHAIPYEREFHLGPGDRIDFLVDGDIGVEVKTRYPRRSTFRQLKRYCEARDLRSLILVTGTTMGLPESINDKPLFIVSVGRGAL